MLSDHHANYYTATINNAIIATIFMFTNKLRENMT